MKYEYYSLKDIDIDKLNLLGLNGWELIIHRHKLDGSSELIFKRQIDD